MIFSLEKLRRASIKNKLIFIILSASGLTLLLTSVVQIIYGVQHSKDTLLHELTITSKIIGQQSSAALEFLDKEAATLNLASFKLNPTVNKACIYDAWNLIFASYPATDNNPKAIACPEQPTPGHHFYKNTVTVTHSIVAGKNIIGTIYIESNLTSIDAYLTQYLMLVMLLIIVAMVTAYLLATRLQHIISDPLFHLVDTAKRFSIQQNYAIRAKKHNDDELGILVDAFNSMLSKLQEATEKLEQKVSERTDELRRQTAFVKLILDAAGEGIYGLDTDGNTTFTNPATLKMTNYSHDEMVGQPHVLLRSHTDNIALKDITQCNIFTAITRGAICRADNELFWRKDGSSFPVEYVCTPIRDEQGIIAGAVVIFRDITERKSAELELKRHRDHLQDLVDAKTVELRSAVEDAKAAQQAAEQANRAKSAFLANMSHELRTPLNSLLILAESFSANVEKNLSAQQVEAAQIIHHSGQNLLELINDILDLAKIEAGKMTLNHGILNLQDIIVNIQTEFSHITNNKGLTLDIQSSHDAPKQILSDKIRLTQILRNFISNAIKFTHRGGIKINIGFAPTSTHFHTSALQQSHVIAFTVNDTGIGIPQEKLATIFKAFEQVDGSTSRKYGGTGLGLSICCNIATLLGGEIHVDSQVGQGSTFTFFAPLHPDTQTCYLTSESAKTMLESISLDSEFIIIEDDKNNLSAGDKLMLIIDDDPTFTKIVYDSFHQKGFKCLVATNGEQGLSLAQNYQPLAIILDIHLPDISGLEIFHRLQKNPTTQQILIYFISIYDDQQNIEGDNIIGYLTKPISQKQLSGAIDKIHSIIDPTAAKQSATVIPSHIKVNEKSDQISPPISIANSNVEPIPQPPTPSKKSTLTNGKKVLLVDNDTRNLFAISLLLKQAQMTVLMASDGSKALNILQEHSNIDIALIDIMMPTMDGYKTIEEIRQQKQKKTLPIIAVTAKAIEEDRQKCFAIGANEYLEKPLQATQLVTAIEQLLQANEKNLSVGKLSDNSGE